MTNEETHESSSSSVYEKELLRQCKKDLGSIKVTLRHFFNFDKDGGALLDMSKFKSLIVSIGQAVDTCIAAQSSSITRDNYERHLWHFVSLFSSSLSGTLFRALYNRLKDASDTRLVDISDLLAQGKKKKT